MPTTITDIPVFDFLRETRWTNAEGKLLHSSDSLLGELSTLNELHDLVPSSNVHIEIERAADVGPEVRVVRSLSGQYYQFLGQAAEEVIATLDETTSAIMNTHTQYEGTLFPGMAGHDERKDELWQSIIIYDPEGYRILPMLFPGNSLIETTEDFWEREGIAHCEAFVTDDFAAIGDRRTGQIHYATDNIRQAISARYSEKYCSDGPPSDY